ncbi:unnamed protein product [Arabidopsis halleri]
MRETYSSTSFNAISLKVGIGRSEIAVVFTVAVTARAAAAQIISLQNPKKIIGLGF